VRSAQIGTECSPSIRLWADTVVNVQRTQAPRGSNRELLQDVQQNDRIDAPAKP